MIVAEAISIRGRLEPVTLGLKPGERVAIVGPNGGGKTSLLRAIAGVEAANGSVIIGGEILSAVSIERRRRLLGLLSASRDLHWPIAVRDLIELGLAQPDPARLDELIAQFELEPLASRRSDTLSTGERARVLMARAMASRPALLLLDEPLSNLDPYWVLRILDLIEEEARRGTALLVSLHDLAHLDRFDRAILIDGGQVKMDETPDLLLASPAFEKAFRVMRADDRFVISREAGRRSSP